MLHLTSLAGAPMTFVESGLVVPFDLTIVGDGALQTEIDAGGVDRIFEVQANLQIGGLTLRNGDASTGSLNCGAIEVQSGDLVVTCSRLIDNRALAGGSIAASDFNSEVRLLFTTAQDNVASANGGAIGCDGCGGVHVLLSRLVDNLAGARAVRSTRSARR